MLNWVLHLKMIKERLTLNCAAVLSVVSSGFQHLGVKHETFYLENKLAHYVIFLEDISLVFT